MSPFESRERCWTRLFGVEARARKSPIDDVTIAATAKRDRKIYEVVRVDTMPEGILLRQPHLVRFAIAPFDDDLFFFNALDLRMEIVGIVRESPQDIALLPKRSNTMVFDSLSSGWRADDDRQGHFDHKKRKSHRPRTTPRIRRTSILFSIAILARACSAWTSWAPHLSSRGQVREPLSRRPSGMLVATSEALLSTIDEQYTALPPTTPTDTLNSPKHSPTNMAYARAQRLAFLLLGDLIAPVTAALMKGWPQNDVEWNDFWLLPTSDNENESLADRVTATLEAMGPTYVKFGQALASRPDVVPPSLAQALASLQDQMQPFDTALAKTILEQELGGDDDEDCKALLQNLSPVPVAAASIGQVYSSYLADGQKVAIKVQRPGIKELVQQDASLLLQMSNFLQAIPGLDRPKLIQTDLVGAVQEFMTRLNEEMDYRNEAKNLETFASLYSYRRPINSTSLSCSIQVVVPQIFADQCTENVLVMEWIDGTKLVDLATKESRQQSLELIEQGIDCTLSQLLETGILHADPHGGNLLKIASPPPALSPGTTAASTEPQKPRLGYVDFGLLATIPVTVRDGLVCAVSELVFERNSTAVAQLFGELALIPDSVLSNPSEMQALADELDAALAQVLIYPMTDETTTSKSTVPQLRFDKLLNVLSRLVPRFHFQLPPYFLNNARALSTLEGMAREINPSFNVLQFLYPYALRRILANPSGSPVVDQTLEHLITNRDTGKVSRRKVRRLVHDVTLLTGYSRQKLLKDVIQSPNGPKLVRRILKDSLVQAVVPMPGKRRRKQTRRPSALKKTRGSGISFRL